MDLMLTTPNILVEIMIYGCCVQMLKFPKHLLHFVESIYIESILIRFWPMPV